MNWWMRHRNGYVPGCDGAVTTRVPPGGTAPVVNASAAAAPGSVENVWATESSFFTTIFSPGRAVGSSG